MRHLSIGSLLGVALLAGAQISLAQNASVTISSPMEGATLSAMAQNKLVYEVVPGPRGDHVHLYVDDKEVAVVRQLKGSHALATLSPGPHSICIKVVDKGHTPIGVEQCVKVSVN